MRSSCTGWEAQVHIVSSPSCVCPRPSHLTRCPESWRCQGTVQRLSEQTGAFTLNHRILVLEAVHLGPGGPLRCQEVGNQGGTPIPSESTLTVQVEMPLFLTWAHSTLAHDPVWQVTRPRSHTQNSQAEPFHISSWYRILPWWEQLPAGDTHSSQHSPWRWTLLWPWGNRKKGVKEGA